MEDQSKLPEVIDRGRSIRHIGITFDLDKRIIWASHLRCGKRIMEKISLDSPISVLCDALVIHVEKTGCGDYIRPGTQVLLNAVKPEL